MNVAYIQLLLWSMDGVRVAPALALQRPSIYNCTARLLAVDQPGDEGNNRSSNNNNNNKYEDLSWETFFRFDCPPNTPTTSSSGDADQAILKRSGFESAPNSTAARVPAETMCRGLVHRAVRQSPVYQNLLRLAMVECSIMGFAICIVAPLWRSLQMVRLRQPGGSAVSASPHFHRVFLVRYRTSDRRGNVWVPYWY